MVLRLTLLVTIVLVGYLATSAQEFPRAGNPESLKESIAKTTFDDPRPFPRPGSDNSDAITVEQPIRPERWMLNFGLFRIVRTALPWRPGQDPYKVSWQRPQICITKNHCATILL